MRKDKNTMEKVEKKLHSWIHNERFNISHSVIQFFVMFCWIVLFLSSRSLVLIYVLVGVLGFSCKSALREKSNIIFRQKERMNLIIASVFSVIMIVANYDIASLLLDVMVSNYDSGTFLRNHSEQFSRILFFVLLPVLFLGGLYHVFYILKYVKDRITPFVWKQHAIKYKPYVIFLAVFLLLSVFYTSVMVFCFYPGSTTYDSVNQLKQILSGEYTNRHPLLHTMLIRLFFMSGKLLFHSANAGAAFYSLFSITLLASTFAYSVSTLYRLQIRKSVLVLMTVFYLILPEHICYSFTMWKDIPFAASVYLFVISVFRHMSRIYQNKNANIAVIVLSGSGLCLLRGNGLLVFPLIIVAFFFLFGKDRQKLLKVFLFTLAMALLINYPVYGVLFNADQPDSLEMLSVPLQQMARTLKEKDDLTPEQSALIARIADKEKIKQLYDPHLSDPIKDYLRNDHDKAVLKEHSWEYALLYLQMGMKHPGLYMEAWVEQTSGFWNPAHHYLRYPTYTLGSDIGLKQVVLSDKYQRIVYLYFSLYYYLDILKPLYNIGFYTWLLMLVIFIAYHKKDKLTLFLTVPCFSIIATLMIGTPVPNESRYAYALLCCVPFLMSIAFRKTEFQRDGTIVK